MEKFMSIFCRLMHLTSFSLLAFLTPANALNQVCYFSPDLDAKEFWDRIDSGMKKCPAGEVSLMIDLDEQCGVGCATAAVARLCDFSKSIVYMDRTWNNTRGKWVTCVLVKKAN